MKHCQLRICFRSVFAFDLKMITLVENYAIKYKLSKCVKIQLTFVLCLVTLANSHMVGNNPFRRRETLDSDGKYILEWLIDWNTKVVNFNVTVKTRGYVGFGLSSNGKMSGADIVIGGVNKSGRAYFSDRHAVGNVLPVLDTSQDWVLHWASESKTHTTLSFSRAFDTCDPEDYIITEDKISLIWAYGEKDNDIEYHHQNRGIFNVFLLNPDYSPPITRDRNTEVTKILGRENTDLKIWTVHSKFEMPAADTTYWCSMHAAPKLPYKHHNVGLDVRFGDERSRQHVHHLLIYKCVAPEGRDPLDLFAPFVGTRGQDCYFTFNPTDRMPVEFCSEYFHGWAVGGRIFFLPSHVGQPFGANPNEYYVVNVHYDNPNKLSNIVVDMRLDFFYTHKLRPIEGGQMAIGHEVPGLPPSLIIPPNSLAQKVYGHCSPGCTRRIFPEDGITVFAMHLHAHNTGRKLRLQHFRNNRELPWILSDDNYGFNYQQYRVLPQEIKVLPGDHLIMSCQYDNTGLNGSTTVSSFGTRSEMCMAFVLYYNKIDNFQNCQSQIESDEYRRFFLGVTNITWVGPPTLEYVVDPPHQLAGLTISQVSDNHVIWDISKRAALQRLHNFHPHANVCPRELFSVDPDSIQTTSDGSLVNPQSTTFTTAYPLGVPEYRRKRYCTEGNQKH